jgi:gluconolactonase
VNKISVCLLLLLVTGTVAPAEDVKNGQEQKTTEVKLKDLTLKMPATWKLKPSTSRMRLATYTIPAAKGDSAPGELTIFNFAGGGGDVGANISRWVDQFSGEGRSSKVTKGKAGDNDYYFANITGTYRKPVGPPILRKTESAPGYRMAGVILVLQGKGVYYLKLAGPDATIKSQAEAFRKSFGGSSDAEEAYEI